MAELILRRPGEPVKYPENAGEKDFYVIVEPMSQDENQRSIIRNEYKVPQIIRDKQEKKQPLTENEASLKASIGLVTQREMFIKHCKEIHNARFEDGEPITDPGLLFDSLSMRILNELYTIITGGLTDEQEKKLKCAPINPSNTDDPTLLESTSA